ncbi:TIGR02452 family protein [Actinacidiphila acidipaludis]|uniref:TIGR02452 family protein n=1 Tax=Actinacidiphila acidipaludis TaxID=2873382 RepID=A0ABS7Q599_9ACTN|nr:TIGR02452 family protein [Streptomyces acidipaludis]MBY8878335.1 TIGR02452 family protein [Streptomyces acidipaludis]
MSARLRNIARENERIVADGGYTAPGGGRVYLATAVGAAADGTRMFGPGPVPVTAVGDGPKRARCTVTGESSTVAARRLAASDGGGSGPVAVLNFASARNPGGGYVNGAQAQEEALCRASALYFCLLRAPEFYAHHREVRDPFYSDRVIHSPAVPVFRDDSGSLLNTPFTAGFLTSPAPNAGVIARTMPERSGEVGPALDVRAERVLEVAVAHGYRRLVLGAWGCGVFRNDPVRVAAAFARLLTGDGRFARAVDEVVFAVLDRRADSPTRAAFAAAFGTPPQDAAPVR